MKRKNISIQENTPYKKFKNEITEDLLTECENNFKNEKTNLLSRNVITTSGFLLASTDYDESRKISHIFLNSLKKKSVKATNQGATGRCWLFSGLNIFRHNLIKALDLNNFEFSETYLYFWDKFERSNCFFEWIQKYYDNDNNYSTEYNNKLFNYLLDNDKLMSDGGYWNYFANLVDKYGLIPKESMPSTFESDFSCDMNYIIMETLQYTAHLMHKAQKNKTKINEIKNSGLKKIYNILVKFLGDPPKTFDWSFSNELDEPSIMQNFTPLSFKELTIPGIEVKDFIVLVNIPNKKFPYYKKYEINLTSNIIGKSNFVFINLPVHELKKYCKNSIISGMPVWFGCDIGKKFHPGFSCLNDKLVNTGLILEESENLMNKEQRIIFKNQKTCHAMTLTGVNFDSKERTTLWQVENSWGYEDSEELGRDGFLSMTDKWFEEYVDEVVIHTSFLSRKIKEIVNHQHPFKIIEPWDDIVPCLKIIPNFRHLKNDF